MAKFRHDAGIPIPFALAVFDIFHGKDLEKAWDAIFETEVKQASTWVWSILKENAGAAANQMMVRWLDEFEARMVARAVQAIESRTPA